MTDSENTESPSQQHMLDFISKHADVDWQTTQEAYEDDEGGLRSLFNLVSGAAQKISMARYWVLGSLPVAVMCAIDHHSMIAGMAAGLTVSAAHDVYAGYRAYDSARDTVTAHYTARSAQPFEPQG